MTDEQAFTIAAKWLAAWDGDDPDRVLALLHSDAVFADPAAGKVRPPDLPGFVGRSVNPPNGTERHVVREWFALRGADSVSIVCVLADDSHRVDTLVLAEDGKIARVMRHS